MSSDDSSRRDFLKIAGATAGGVAIIGAGAVAAQSGESSGMTQVRLGGEVAGWQGVEPESISDTTNPTLQFVAGEEITVTWENLDGQPHNFQVLDSSGSVLHKTETMSEQGATQTTSFTATMEMAQYNCVVHPSSMLGDVSVSSGSSQQSGGNQTQTQTQTETQTESGTETAANGMEGVQTSHLGEKPPAFNVSSQGSENGTQQMPETETETATGTETEQGNETQRGGNGKAKSGNGKAKSGNGKAKSGSGNQTK